MSTDIQKIVDGEQATEVRWDVEGLRPNATFEIQFRCVKANGMCVNILREVGDLRQGVQAIGNVVPNVLTMRYLVVCGGESGYRYSAEQNGNALPSRNRPVIIADRQGKAHGLSVERGLNVQSVVGKMILLRDISNQEREQDSHEPRSKWRGLALGIVGCLSRTTQ